jgi:hypothetical protein
MIFFDNISPKIRHKKLMQITECTPIHVSSRAYEESLEAGYYINSQKPCG